MKGHFTHQSVTLLVRAEIKPTMWKLRSKALVTASPTIIGMSEQTTTKNTMSKIVNILLYKSRSRQLQKQSLSYN